MRKLDLTPYEVRMSDGQELRTIPYEVRASCAAVLFHPELRLSARDLLKSAVLAEKIERAGDAVLLEEEEYERLKAAVEAIHTYARNDVEFVNRVLDAPAVQVQEQSSV